MGEHAFLHPLVDKLNQLDELAAELNGEQAERLRALSAELRQMASAAPTASTPAREVPAWTDLYLRALEDLPTLMWRAGLDGKCDYFNHSWLEFTGRTMEQEMGDGWAEGVHPDDLARCMITYRQAFAKREPFEMVYRLRHHTGRYCWILDIGRPIQDLNGNFAGYIGTCLDVTDHKELEQALRESENRFKGLFEWAPDGVLVVDEVGRISLVNQQVESMFGYSRAELVGQPVEVLMPPTYRQQHAHHIRGYMREPHLRPMGLHLDLQGQRQDGSLFPVDITLGPVKTDRGLIVLATIRNITERKRIEAELHQSESRFRSIFDNASQGIVLLDLEGRILEANPAFREMLGMQTSEVGDRNLASWLHGRERANLRQGITHLVSSEVQQLRSENRYIKADGSILWGQLSLGLVLTPAGEPQYMIGMMENITAQKHAEAELAELQRRLMDSSEGERLHLAQELHDGPLQELQGIVYTLSFLEKEVEDPAEREQIIEALNQVKGVNSSIRALCGELRPPALAPFGLEKAIRSHADQFQNEHPDIRVKLDLMSDGQAFPERVRLALFRIYQHAMANAVRHAEANQVEVQLQFDQEKIVLLIQDNGKGFRVPRRWIELVRSGHFGLVGARERAESVGGYLEVKSAPDQGTQLQVVVPRQEEYQITYREQWGREPRPVS